MIMECYELNHMTLNPSQRKTLKSLAHHLDTVIHIGKEGFNDRVAHSISENLEKRELIKVKFYQHKDDKKQISEKIASKTKSELVSIIGNTLIIYKQSNNPKNRQIKL